MFKTIATIKGTAKSKDKARVLIQRLDLEQYGFAVGTPIDITLGDTMIVIKAHPEGSRKVARVTDNRSGKVYQTLDIKMDAAQRDTMFDSCPKLAIKVREEGGVILITRTEQE